MACTYIYNGRRYTRFEILRLIRQGEIIGTEDMTKARKWLKDNLGMSDEDIVTVKGLIDGRSLGRFLRDGRILLSDQMTDGVQYHEGFHRVFNMMLSEEERQAVLDEFRQRDNWQDSLNGVKRRYKGKSEDKQIEEYLAEEFRLYQLNDGDFKVPGPKTQSAFARILHFLRTLLGLESKLTIEDLYKNIRAGKYASKPVLQYADENREALIIDGELISAPDKQELVENITWRILESVVANKGIYRLMDGSFSITALYGRAVWDLLSTELLSNPSLNNIAELVAYDTFIVDDEGQIKRDEKGNRMLNADSKLFLEMRIHLATLGVKLSGFSDYVETDAKSIDEQDDAEDAQQKDHAFNKVSFEFDPMNSVAKGMRLLLSSIADVDAEGFGKASKSLGIMKPVKYSEIVNVLFHELAGMPADYEIIYSKLVSATDRYPYLRELLKVLGRPRLPFTNDYDQHRLRNEFITSFVKNRYNFLVGLVREDNIFSTSLVTDSQRTKVLSGWKNRLLQSYANGAELAGYLNSTRTAAEIADVLGMDELREEPDLLEAIIDDTGTRNVALALSEIKARSLKAIEAGTPIHKLFDRNPNEELSVEGSVRSIADVVASQGRPIDLMMFNAESKRIYSISLHNYQTIVLGTLNWIGAQDRSIEEKIELLKLYAPHIINPSTYDQETGQIKSIWLQKILQGNALKLEVFDGINVGFKRTSFSELKETDQIAFQIAAEQQGKTFSMKHGDRSVMFVYSLTDGHRFVTQSNYEQIMSRATEYAINYLADEVRRVIRVRNAVKSATPEDSENGYGISNLAKRGQELVQFSFLSDRDLEKAIAILEQGAAPEVEKAALKSAFGTPIRAHFENLTLKARAEMNKWGVDTLHKKRDSVLKPVGIGRPAWEQFYRENGADVNRALNAAAAQATVNYFFSYAEQQKLLIGDIASYKSPVDLYKRMQMQSSTGEVMVVDLDNNEYMEYVQNRDEILLRDPLTGKLEAFSYGPLKRTGYQSEIVLKSSKYRSRSTVADDSVKSKLNDESVSPLRYVFEQGVYADLVRLGFTEEEAKRIALERAQEWEKPFTEYDENDGMSWGSLFFWREYHHRLGTFSRQKENVFQVELAVLGSDDISETVVYVSKDRMTIKARIEPQEQSQYILVKIFDTKEVEEKLRVKKATGWYNKVLDYGTMSKPQYTGPFYPDAPPTPETVGSADYIPAGRKTAYGFLFPSMIKGTKLEQMHAVMLRKGVDTIHMDSAAKYGRKEPGAFAPESAYTLYDPEGKFNQEIEQYANEMVSYLDLRYQKDQVRIHTSPKAEIKNATQSAKILLSNLMDNGIPRDLPKEQEQLFLAANDDGRKSMSPMYKVFRDYEDAMEDMIYARMDELEEEFGVTTESPQPDLERLHTILKKSAIQKVSPLYILDAIDSFLETESIEMLPNSNRIENILFSIVTNRVISIKRTGDSKPQFSASLFESIQRNRERDNSGRALSSESVQFYRPVISDTGEVTEVKPAEVILPLQPNMINQLLALTGESNVMRAIRTYNGWSDDKKFLLKSSRIPNQQLSFNDVLLVKKFTSPLYQGYAILPSEIVVKNGSDFDIDKAQLYMQSLDSEGKVIRLNKDNPTVEGVMNDLLDKEMAILLHPKNAHYLLAPSSDSWLKEDLFTEIVSKMESVSPQVVRNNRDQFEMKITADGVMSLVDNIVNGIMLLESKANVGLVATGVTIHAVSQADKLALEPFYEREERTDKGEIHKVRVSSALPFQGMEGYEMSGIADISGRTILETLSTLLTSQVDGASNPYAPRLNLVTETLPIVTFLVRRRVPLRAALSVVSAPLVRKYLEMQRIHRSNVYATAGGRKGVRLSKKDVQNKIAELVGSNGDELRNRVEMYKKGHGYGITDQDMASFISSNKPEANQLQALAAFIYLDEMTQDFRMFSEDITPDTRPMKNMAMVNHMESNWAKLSASGMIDTDYREGFLRPFFQAREMYRDLFGHLYKLPLDKLENLADGLAYGKGWEDRVKIRETLSGDLITYILQNYAEPYNKYSFVELFSGPNSVAKEIQLLKDGKHPTYGDQFTDNFAIQAILPVLKAVEKDEYIGGKSVDAVRILERGSSTMTLNDMYEEFEMLPADIQEKLLVVGLFQSGMSYSPFSLDPMLTVALKQEAMLKALEHIAEMDEDEISRFSFRFLLNHPELLPRWASVAKRTGIPLIAERDDTTGEFVIKDSSGKVYMPTGNRYYRRYSNSIVPGIKTQDQLVSEQEERNEEILKSAIQTVQLKPVTIAMQLDKQVKILAGTKTIIVGSDSQMKEIGLAVGQSGVMTIEGKKFVITNRGLLTVQEAGGLNTVLKGEGHTNVNQIKHINVRKWVQGDGSRLFVYDIKPYIETPANPDWTEKDHSCPIL